MLLRQPRFDRKSFRRHQAGFSLLEVLIAMIVLSLGLLGLAALQLNALRFNQVAQVRTQASFLAYQILDGMRANPEAVSDGGFDIAIGGSPVGGTAPSRQLTFWKEQMAAQLPSGDGSICRSSIPDPSVACTGMGEYVIITVQWQEAGAADETTGERAQQSLQLVSQVTAS